MKHSRTIWSFPTTSSACMLSVENFSQRISLIRGVRKYRNKQKTVKQDKAIIVQSVSKVKSL